MYLKEEGAGLVKERNSMCCGCGCEYYQVLLLSPSVILLCTKERKVAGIVKKRNSMC